MKDIEKLLEKYYEGETTLAEEKQLRAFFAEETIPQHLQSHAAQFRFLAESRNEIVPDITAAWLDETSEPASPGKVIRFSPAQWARRIAAGIGLLLIGFSGGCWFNQTKETPAQVQTSASEAGLVAMKNVLHFDQVGQTSASERIRAVNQATELNQADREVTQLLINTMNFDDNVNVRLAACEALYRFKDAPGVREAFIQSLKIQTDPNVQIVLIDILVDIREKRAVDEMQRLIQDKNTMKVVRLKAEQGIGTLI
jgi:hypothetical protein